MSNSGPYEDDPRQEEFLNSIKKAGRTRIWFPFLILGFLILNLLLAGESVFQRPVAENAYLMVIIIALIGVGIEVLNVKVLLLKAEYRDWLRDFRNERWKDMSDD